MFRRAKRNLRHKRGHKVLRRTWHMLNCTSVQQSTATPLRDACAHAGMTPTSRACRQNHISEHPCRPRLLRRSVWRDRIQWSRARAEPRQGPFWLCAPRRHRARRSDGGREHHGCARAKGGVPRSSQRQRRRAAGVCTLNNSYFESLFQGAAPSWRRMTLAL